MTLEACRELITREIAHYHGYDVDAIASDYDAATMAKTRGVPAAKGDLTSPLPKGVLSQPGASLAGGAGGGGGGGGARNRADLL